jgi:hypothetical protein
MIAEKLNSLTVKVNEGSGCFFHTGETYDYILTARHCIAELKTDDEIRNFDKEAHPVTVWIGTAKNDEQKINVLDYIISDYLNLDIAIILVGAGNDVHSVEYQDPRYKEQVVVYGYPNMRASDIEPRESLECTVELDSQENKLFDLTATNPLHSYNREPIENVEGFSGGGIFRIAGEEIQLIGIIMRLKNREGVFSKLVAANISNFNSILEGKTYQGKELKPLVPYFLTSFEHYIEEVFEFDNPILKEILLEQAQLITQSGVTPKSIADFLNDKIFIPHSKGLSVNNPEMWKGWIEFLTYLSLVSLEERLDISPKSLIRPDLANKNQYFYYYLSKGKKWGPVIRYLLIEPQKSYKHGSRFFINGVNAIHPHILTPEHVAGIIKDISNPEEQRLASRKLEIDKADLSKKHSFVHFQRFTELFTDQTFFLIREAEKLKEEVQTILRDLLSHE